MDVEASAGSRRQPWEQNPAAVKISIPHDPHTKRGGEKISTVRSRPLSNPNAPEFIPTKNPSRKPVRKTEKRRDARNGKWYSKNEFVSYYGRVEGMKLWESSAQPSARRTVRERGTARGGTNDGSHLNLDTDFPQIPKAKQHPQKRRKSRLKCKEQTAPNSPASAATSQQKTYHAACRRAVLGIIREHMAALEQSFNTVAEETSSDTKTESSAKRFVIERSKLSDIFCRKFPWLVKPKVSQ